MNKFIPFGLALLAVLVFVTGAEALQVRSFNQIVHVIADASLDVEETIVLDWPDTLSPAFYRIIPIEYQDFGKNYHLDIRVLSITDAAGKPIDFSQTGVGSKFSIRIARPSEESKGEQVYRLHYVVRRAINFFNHPEICWNATGESWPFVIRQANITIYLAHGSDATKLNIVGFSGYEHSRQPLLGDSNKDSITFNATDIKPGQGLTILINLPKGAVAPPSLGRRISWFLADWWLALALPLITLTGVLGAVRIFRKDGPAVTALPVRLEMLTSLSPAEAASLIDEKFDMHEISSTLIDLGARGLLQIEEIPGEGFLSLSTKDYLFTRGNGQANLASHEELILSGLFAENLANGGGKVKLSDLKGKFSLVLPAVKQAVYASLISKGQFRCYPDDVEKSCYAAAFAISILGTVIFVAGAKGSCEWQAAAIGLILSGLIVFFFAPFMQARSVSGSHYLGSVRAFQRYMLIADKGSIQLLAKNDPKAFGRLLAYAMVLGVADKWAEAFQDLIEEAPSWFKPYTDRSMAQKVSSQSFVAELGSGMRTVERILSS
jgi:hypothetical protein